MIKKTIAPALTLTFMLVIVCVVFFSTIGAPEIAEASDLQGTISGTVSADRGKVRGFSVKARDTTHRITYTVFTRNGLYRVPNLPASSYEVRVVQTGFESPVEKVDLRAAEKKTMDLVLKAQETKPSKVQFVDYDTLYPPGPGREALERRCMPCHARTTYHRQRRTREGWKRAVQMMTDPNVPSPSNENGVPEILNLPQQEADTIIEYLAENFGPGVPARELKLDEFPVDEDALGDAVFIEYDLPGPKENALFRTASSSLATPDTTNLGHSRNLHDPFIAPDGSVFFDDHGSNSIIHLDPHELDFQKRFREYPIKSSSNVYLHGITLDKKGHLYWAEMTGGHLGELDPASGEQERHLFPSKGAMLQVVTDSKDNIWYGLMNGTRIGKLDAKTRKISDWEAPTPGGDIYGLIVDHNDKLWGAESAIGKILKFDPVTEKFSEYPTPTQPSGIRRLCADSKGKIWFGEYFGGNLGVLDPATGKITEYAFPLKYTQSYEVWPDAQDNIWISDVVYDSIIKFDPISKKFTYYPLPQPGYTVPKIEVDKEGTLWFGSRFVRNITAVAFKPKGNSMSVRAGK